MAPWMVALGLILEIIRDWHVGRLQRLRNAAVAVVVVPLILIFAGSFLGAVSFGFKAAVLAPTLIGTWVAAIFFAAHRAPIAIEIASVVRLGQLGRRQVGRAIVTGTEDYVRLVAAILTSELGIGLVALWLPMHQYPSMALVLIPVMLLFFTHAVWQVGPTMWPRVVYWVGILTMAAAIFLIVFPGINWATMASAARGLFNGWNPLFPALVLTLFLAAGLLMQWRAAAGVGLFLATVVFLIWWAVDGRRPAPSVPASARGRTSQRYAELVRRAPVGAEIEFEFVAQPDDPIGFDVSFTRDRWVLTPPCEGETIITLWDWNWNKLFEGRIPKGRCADPRQGACCFQSPNPNLRSSFIDIKLIGTYYPKTYRIRVPKEFEVDRVEGADL